MTEAKFKIGDIVSANAFAQAYYKSTTSEDERGELCESNGDKHRRELKRGEVVAVMDYDRNSIGYKIRHQDGRICDVREVCIDLDDIFLIEEEP